MAEIESERGRRRGEERKCRILPCMASSALLPLPPPQTAYHNLGSLLFYSNQSFFRFLIIFSINHKQARQTPLPPHFKLFVVRSLHASNTIPLLSFDDSINQRVKKISKAVRRRRKKKRRRCVVCNVCIVCI